MKHLFAGLIALASANAFAAPSNQVRCEARLIQVTGNQLTQALAKENWDVGSIQYSINNYGLEGRHRTVHVCKRASQPDQTCIIEVFTRFENLDAEGCPNYVPAEVTSTCTPAAASR